MLDLRRLISVGFVLAVGATAALAQTPSRPAAPATPTAGQPVTPAQALDFSDLRDFLKKQLDTVKKLGDQAAAGIQDAQQAGDRFDEMIAAYKALIEAVGSKSEYSRKIDAFIAQYEGYAAEAAGDPNPKIRQQADEFLTIAKNARDVRAQFIVESDKAGANIDRLGQMKAEAIVAFRLLRGQQVVEAYRGQLIALQEANGRVDLAIKQAESKLPVSGPKPQ